MFITLFLSLMDRSDICEGQSDDAGIAAEGMIVPLPSFFLLKVNHVIYYVIFFVGLSVVADVLGEIES
jgi:hypothetical protein